MLMKPLRNILGLNSSFKCINEVTKNKNKLLKLKDFNPCRQLLAVKLLHVLVILAKIMFHSHIFHINESIKTTFGFRFGLKTH